MGIALYDGSGVGGLLHAMLPEAPETIDKPAKYVDSGVDLLVDRMTDLGAKQTSLKGKLTGGSSMLDLGGETPVGEKNVEAAMKRLEAANVEVVAEETGGNIGRSVAFTPATGHLRVKRVDEEVHEI